jgi:hypothetical protein
MVGVGHERRWEGESGHKAVMAKEVRAAVTIYIYRQECSRCAAQVKSNIGQALFKHIEATTYSSDEWRRYTSRSWLLSVLFEYYCGSLITTL